MISSDIDFNDTSQSEADVCLLFVYMLNHNMRSLFVKSFPPKCVRILSPNVSLCSIFLCMAYALNTSTFSLPLVCVCVVRV